MIHWTRQIKEVLSSQDTYETAETSGPLEEIQFWNSRCMDLSGISDQLDKPGVKHIQKILQMAKSSYVAPFMKLSKLIQVTQTWRDCIVRNTFEILFMVWQFYNITLELSDLLYTGYTQVKKTVHENRTLSRREDFFAFKEIVSCLKLIDSNIVQKAKKRSTKYSIVFYRAY